MQRRYTETERARIREALWAYKNQFRRYGFDVMANDIAEATGADRTFVYWTKLRNFLKDNNWVDDLFVEHCEAFMKTISPHSKEEETARYLMPNPPENAYSPLADIKKAATFDMFVRPHKNFIPIDELAKEADEFTWRSTVRMEPLLDSRSARVIEYNSEELRAQGHEKTVGVLVPLEEELYAVDMLTRYWAIGITSHKPLTMTGYLIDDLYLEWEEFLAAEFAMGALLDIQLRVRSTE